MKTRNSIAAANKSSRIPAESFSTRFSLPSFCKQVGKLTDDQRTAIKRIGFGSLLKLPNQIVRKTLLMQLMDRWNSKKNVFALPPGDITITPLDSALILGLRVTGEPLVLKDDEPFSELEREYGAALWKRTLTLASIENRLESLGGVANDDFVRTFMLFTFGTLLFPTPAGKVDSRYLSFLNDLDNVYRYAWGTAVVDYLFTWLSKRKEMSLQSIGGCLILLQIWCYEHIDIERPSLLDCCFPYPRACRWANERSRHKKWLATKFKELEENQITWKLQPTFVELETNIMKELMGTESNHGKELLLSPRQHTSAEHLLKYHKGLISSTDVSIDSVVELESDPEMDIAKANVVLQENLQQLSSPQHAQEQECQEIKIQMLEKQILNMKQKMDEQGRELEDLRRENHLLSSSNLVARLAKILLILRGEEDIAAADHTQLTPTMKPDFLKECSPFDHQA